MRRAVVLGGSFAGLLAARVLHDFAEEVTIVEPDHERAPATRSGAPHRDQLHALLAMGHEQLERLFPALTDEMVEVGAQLGSGEQIQFYTDGRLKPSVPDARMIGATRTFIEDHIRRRVLDLPRIKVLPHRSTGVRVHAGRVDTVSYVTAEGHRDELPADFTVDAMGRSSRLGRWLENEGWPAPRVERMQIDLGYATARFHRGHELPDTVVAHSTPGPASNYLPSVCEPGALTAVENDRWNVVLAGYTGYRPTSNPAAFLTRMRRCVAPIQQVADLCEMDGEPTTFHVRDSRRRHYQDVPRLPGGLAVVGDAFVSVNPIYGQGLTLSALHASALDRYLRTGASPHRPATGYFRRANTVVNAAWTLSTTADLAQPHVTGPYPLGYPVVRWAADRVTEASIVDAQINRTFMDVLHMRRHPRALTHPRILLRTARTLATRTA
ncbi:FAD-dependent monooxygenase [Streptomyces sp. NBC_01433]|uniref:FAD-dependent oxidoreductase n=1 Tax=Streptomyces sp. NBC_01433 TaxID=2903864 RepID=UPI00225ACE2E|nr:FAD-dependent monooxygenase [Streptomyces sp. NBC_01433]MCX4682133.1 FAD-dependent monooxygenase [Streptomyces sp. NBC_01433]